MAMVMKTLEEIRKEVTPMVVEDMIVRLDNHVDEYDSENPPLTNEELEELHKIAEKRRQARKSFSLSA